MSCLCLGDVCSTINRKKQLGSGSDLFETPLQRSLSTTQLVLMGLGSMIGAGLFVLTGVVAKDTVGPAIVVSYVIAAIASLLAAACYVEFACRIPRTGSAYTFTYIAIGEIWAFLIGWNLILEYAISAAAVATAFVGYLDSFTNYAITNFTIETIMGGQEWDVDFIAPYPNIFACVLVVLITVFVITGVNVSSTLNAGLMVLNVVVISIIIIMGFMNADISNWEDYGGFVPYGPSSVISGAATLFFSFVGFDVIAIASEETADPRTSIPRATFLSILITSVFYVLSSAVLTLMVPYTELDESSAFAYAFEASGIEWARWIVGLGALTAMFTSVLMGLYSLPRSVYAMAADGLLFRGLSWVSPTTKVPTFATIFAMVLVLVPCMFFSLDQLVEFLSIGALLGYAFVAGAVIILRYKADNILVDAGVEMASTPPESMATATTSSMESSPLSEKTSDIEERETREKNLVEIPGTLRHRLRAMPIVRNLTWFNPGVVVWYCLCTSVFFAFCALILLEEGSAYLVDGDWWAILMMCVFTILSLISFMIIPLHYQTQDTCGYFRVPWSPLVPWLSVVCDIALVIQLQAITWLRFLVWVTAGLLIYVAYGVRNSSERQNRHQRLENASESEENINTSPTHTSGAYGSLN